MNPPSIPPPPPPPPPLNIPPSRARLQLAARLAMSKRKAEGQENGNGDDDEETQGASKGGLGGLLQSAPVVERLRNPFADDEDDDDDQRDDEGHEGDNGGSGGWNRGSWWRDVVRRKTKRNDGKERFGDGRDDSDDEASGTNSEDEEFGDFAMPEGEGSNSKSQSGHAEGESGDDSGHDDDRDKVLLKPLPVHPPPGGGKSSAFSSLWPFSNQGFGSKEKEKDKDKSEDKPESGGKETAEKGGDEPEALDDPNIVSEDGKKVERAVEAQRRTSIEDLDDDETEVVL